MFKKKEDILFEQLLKGRDLQKLTKFIIQSSKSVLDIGCGIGDYLKYTSPDIKVTAVEPHMPYLEVAKGKTPWVTFYNTDGISFLKNTNEKFDCILLIDVVEHLPESESIQLVKLAKEHSNKIVFSQIPIGIHEQHGDDWNLGGEFWQTHRSTWTKENIDKLGFDQVEIWNDWYQWEENVQKSKDTSIAIILKENDQTGLVPLWNDYIDFLQKDNYEQWQKAYQDGYNSDMGDHSLSFYNENLAGLGLYELINNSKTIIEYGPSNATFMKKFIEIFPEKKFYLAEYFTGLTNKLKRDFSVNKNVEVLLNYPEISSLSNIDLIFSFLLSQSMPKTLWINHLRNVKSMLSKNGSYIFQFAYHPDGFANDEMQNGIYGNNKYKPEEIYKMLEEAGYSGCDLSVPITLERLNSDIVWYFCRVY